MPRWSTTSGGRWYWTDRNGGKTAGERVSAGHARENTVVGKDKGEQMKKRMIVLLGVLSLAVLAGCGAEEEKKAGELTMPPVETLTEIPEPTEEVTPTGDVKITTSVQEDEEQPYEVQFTETDEVTEEKDGDFVYFKSAIHYPVFKGKNAAQMNRFVTSLVEAFRETLPDAKENAKFDYDESKTNAYGGLVFPEVEEFTVSCIWGKEQYQSVFVRHFSDIGGVHPNTYCKAYVVDVTDGYKETFESMLRPYGVTTDEVVAFATTRIQAEHGEELFPTDDENELESWVYLFTQMDQWYFNENGLVLFANPYDIAAYAYGMIECEISYEELEQGLKK